MSPQVGVYGKADVDADIAVHAALTKSHGVTTAIADTDDIAAHAELATVHQDAPALIGTHAELATVHQDAPDLIATHAGISDAHHSPMSFTELVGGEDHEAATLDWEDWDLSAIIGAGAKAVLIGVHAHTTIGDFGVRKNGSALVRLSSSPFLTTKDFIFLLTECDANRVIEIRDAYSTHRHKFSVFGYWS